MKAPHKSKTILINAAFALISGLVAALVFFQSSLPLLQESLDPQTYIVVGAAVVGLLALCNVLLRFVTTEPVGKADPAADEG